MVKAPSRTLYDKIFDDHVVARDPEGPCVLYIDRHLVEDHASPQAFDGLRKAGRRLRAPEKTLAVVDHNIPTTDRAEELRTKRAGFRLRRSPETPKSLRSSTLTNGTCARELCM